MRKYAWLTILILLLAAAFFNGCSKKSSNPKAAIVGIWEVTSYIEDGESYEDVIGLQVIFRSDHTGASRESAQSSWEFPFTWSASGNRLTMESEEEDYQDIYTYNISGNSLTLIYNGPEDFDLVLVLVRIQ